jgi:hypothetical protein
MDSTIEDCIAKFTAGEFKELIVSCCKLEHYEKILLLASVCERGNLPMLQWLFENRIIYEVDVFEYKEFALKQTCKNCNFHILRWLWSNFASLQKSSCSLTIYGKYRHCINYCFRNFQIEDLEDVIWLCEELNLSHEDLQQYRQNLFDTDASCFIHEPKGNIDNFDCLITALKQGPLIKSATKLY